MAANWLKLNDNKTEFVVFGRQQNLKELSTQSLTLVDAVIPVSESLKSIGATLDNSLNMDKQIAAMCKSAWYNLHQISKIRKCLTIDQTKTIVHAYITSRLEQNNGLLLGQPKKALHKLQMVQNASARLVTGTQKRDRVSE